MDLDEPRERRRLVLTLCNADFAIEWLRSMPPNFKMIGPVLPEPASPLPPNIEVRPELLRSFCAGASFIGANRFLQVFLGVWG